MKKTLSLALALLLLVAFALSLAGCGSPAEPEGEVAMLNAVPLENAVKPPDATLTEEDKAILDEYYEKMIEQFPSWGEIPREMLRESCSRPDDELTVRFCFYLGGLFTGCECVFRSSFDSEGSWKLTENGFRKYYACGVSREEMDDLLDRLVAQIEKAVEDRDLVARDPIRDSIFPRWYDENGVLSIRAEYIAYYPESIAVAPGVFPTDHEHLFATVVLD